MNKKLYITLLFCLPICLAAADAKEATKIPTPSTIQSPRSAFSLVSPRSIGSCGSFRSDSRISVGCSDTSEIFIPTPEQRQELIDALGRAAQGSFEEGQQKAAEQAKATAQAAKLEARKKAASEEKIKEIQRSVVGCPIS